MEDNRMYGYMRVSTREQNEDRQRIVLLGMGVPEKNIFMDRHLSIKRHKLMLDNNWYAE